MTPLPTPLAFSLILALLLIDGASAWHTEIRDHDMLAFGRDEQRWQQTTNEKNTSTSSTHITITITLVAYTTFSKIIHDSEYSHTVDVSSNLGEYCSKIFKQRRRLEQIPFVRGDQQHHDDNSTAEEETALDLPAVTDVTACMSDFGCFWAFIPAATICTYADTLRGT
jgi:hypothetical protein